MSETTFYERLGRRDAIEMAVDEFYARVLDTKRLVDLFEDLFV